MHISVKLHIHDIENSRPTTTTVFVEITGNESITELTQKIKERASEFTKKQPKSCSVLMNGKELPADWKKSNTDNTFEAKIVKQ